MEKRWYQFTDDTRTVIRGSSANKQDESQDPQEELEETDARVQDFLGPPWARSPYQEFDISSVDELVQVLSAFGGSPLPLWRGQPNADWPLSTAIERDRDKFLVEQIGLHTYENRILGEAKRRAHHHDVASPAADDLLGWLSFLRHHGVPTRLLDATKSQFVAAYFAVPPEHDGVDGAIWMFSQFQLSLGLRKKVMSTTDPFYRPHSFGVVLDSYQAPTLKAQTEAPRTISQQDLIFGDTFQLIELAINGSLAIEGVLVVEPGQWLDRRQDVQQGLFLFPLNLRASFQKNLESTIEAPLRKGELESVHRFPSDTKLRSVVQQNVAVLKLILPASIKRNVRYLLERMNIRPSVLFPDQEGQVMELKGLVPPKGTWTEE